MPTLYLRVSDQAKNYVAGIARAAGISESRAAELVLLRAESACWTISGSAVVESLLCSVCGATDHVDQFHRDPITGLIGGGNVAPIA